MNLTKKILSLSMMFILLSQSFVSAESPDVSMLGLRFNDVYNHFHSPSINYLEARGIVQGNPDGTFRPNNKINRAEMAKVLAEATFNGNFSMFRRKCFSDVPYGAWYTPYVCFMKDQGMISGYPDGTFRPSDDVNNVEAFKFIMEAYRIPKKTTPNVSMPWFYTYVEDASKMNLIPLDLRGFSDGMTRGQVSDMIARTIHFKMNALDTFLGRRAQVRHSYPSLDAYRNKMSEVQALDARLSLRSCYYDGKSYNNGTTFKNRAGQECFCNASEILYCNSLSGGNRGYSTPTRPDITGYNVTDLGYNRNRVRVYFDKSIDSDGYITSYYYKRYANDSYKTVSANRSYIDFETDDNFSGTFSLYARDNDGRNSSVDTQYVRIDGDQYDPSFDLGLNVSNYYNYENHFDALLDFDLPRNVSSIDLYVDGVNKNVSNSSSSYRLRNLNFNQTYRVRLQVRTTNGNLYSDDFNITRRWQSYSISDIRFATIARGADYFRGNLTWNDTSVEQFRIRVNGVYMGATANNYFNLNDLSYNDSNDVIIDGYVNGRLEVSVRYNITEPERPEVPLRELEDITNLRYFNDDRVAGVTIGLISWNGPSNVTYNIYRDGTFIGSTATLSYDLGWRAQNGGTYRVSYTQFGRTESATLNVPEFNISDLLPSSLNFSTNNITGEITVSFRPTVKFNDYANTINYTMTGDGVDLGVAHIVNRSYYFDAGAGYSKYCLNLKAVNGSLLTDKCYSPTN